MGHMMVITMLMTYFITVNKIGKCTPITYSYFSNAFFVILHITLTYLQICMNRWYKEPVLHNVLLSCSLCKEWRIFWNPAHKLNARPSFGLEN